METSPILTAPAAGGAAFAERVLRSAAGLFEVFAI